MAGPAISAPPRREYTVMAFAREGSWVWDVWFADDGATYHLFYLHAPRSLGNPHLRHRNAVIGHATSPDLVEWEDHGDVLGPGDDGAFDATATWTGSVVRGDDGLWRMFYTGARFLSEDDDANTETIGLATSVDLHTWVKVGAVLSADPRHYETLGDSDWLDEAWRDPWVYRLPTESFWRMLITARSTSGELNERGVVGQAWSADLESWETGPAISEVPSDFAHLEVLQVVSIEDRHVLVFSAATSSLSGRSRHAKGGIWVVDDVAPEGPFPIDSAVLLTDERLYSGRVVVDRNGRAVLLAFENEGADGEFIGAMTDPLPIRRDRSGRLVLDGERAGGVADPGMDDVRNSVG
jgi:beta-fructofuranosidase